MPSNVFFGPDTIVDDQAISSSFNKDIDVLNVESMTLEFLWAGSDSEGTVTIQGSVSGTSFTTLRQCDDTAVTLTITGASGNDLITLSEKGLKSLNKVRINYVASSGTAGTMDINRSGVRIS